jgi:Ca2+-transporting ATPase
MATGQKDYDPATFDPSADLLPLIDGLTLLAIVGIVDPARPEAKLAIAEAKSAGIRVRMITGDHAVTAGAIAGQLGIEGRAITGAEFAAMSDDEAIRQIDDIGVIARVAPEDKVHLVDILKAKGNIVAMTGDGVNDAPALKRADIGVAMGITGTEVSKEAAVMILTDDNFATIVKAVRVGRALYDNLMRYIRFQMAVLFGFIATFLGSSIFNISRRHPFLPPDPLGELHRGRLPGGRTSAGASRAKGLMEDPPRPKDRPILPRRLTTWLCLQRPRHGRRDLSVIVWSTNTFSETVAHTMGLTTFSLFNLFFSLETANEDRSLFSSELLENPMLVKTSFASLIAIVAATELGFFHRLLDTVSLTLEQWAVCAAVGASIIVICEVKKLLHIRVTEEVSAPAGEAASAAAVAA